MDAKHNGNCKEAPDGEAILREVDRESKFRNLAGIWKHVLAVLSCAFIGYHLITCRFGMPPAFKHRAIHLGFILALVFLYYPATKKSPKKRPSVLDLILILITAGVVVYTYNNIDALALRGGSAVNSDYIVGAICMLLVLEACRRVVGPQLLILVVVFLIYVYFGRYFPGVLSHRGYSIQRLIYQMYLTTQGIFGLPLGVSSTYLVIFIVLAALLGESGLGQLFNDVALAVGGKMVGGPAKVAVIASALCGTISGSAATNVATTGAFTIPLMKRVGYKPYFAGAVEAAASTGGQIMPPIMGTAAFIMAEFTGVSYLNIAAAAIIPALMYFGAVFFQIDLRARRRGLHGLSDEEIPDAMDTIRRYGHMAIPLFVLVFFLYKGFTPMYAAFYTIVFTWLLALIRKETRMGPRKLVNMAVSSARSCLSVGVAMANAGFIVGVLSMTGIGLILADNIVSLSRGSMFITLLLTMIVSIILGMGLPTSACYVIASSIAAPLLTKVGVPLFQAHFFVMYFSVLSTITPPVALASYVGAGMSGASTNEVGWTAFRLALAGFIVPFFFVYSPALILIADSSLEIVLAVITGTFGTYLLAVAIEGYFGIVLPVWLRVIVFAAAVLLMAPGASTDVIGIALTIGVWLASRILRRKVSIPIKSASSDSSLDG